MKWHTNRNFLSVRCCSTSLRSWRHCGIGFKVLRLNFPGFRHCKRTRGRGTSMLRQPSREIPWTLEQVRALEEGRELQASDERSQQEVLNYFAGLRFVEKHAQEDHSAQRFVSTAQTPGGWRDGSKGNRVAIAWFPCESVTPFRRLLPMSPD